MRNIFRNRVVPGLLAASLLAFTFSATAAHARFTGGGVLFGFTPACAADGYGPNAVVPVRTRYVDYDVTPQASGGSSVTIAMASGAYHYALWQTPLAETGTRFLGAAGRLIFTSFVFQSNRPFIRVVQRAVVTRMDESGPRTIQNARSVVLRLRIQNFGDLPGCAATLATTVRRR